MFHSLSRAMLIVLFLTAAAAAEQPAVYKAQVTPRWLDNSRFWYRNELPAGGQEYIYVDAEAGVRTPAFDLARLAEALSEKTGQTVTAQQLQVRIVSRDAASVTVVFRGDPWRCNLETYELTPGEAPPETRRAAVRQPRSPYQAPFTSGPIASPDGKLTAVLREGNIFVGESPESATQLSTDGRADFPYDRMLGSPDGRTLVAYRIERGDHKVVYRLESSPAGRNGASGGGVGRAVLQSDEYPLPRDKLDSFELNLFDVESRQQIKPQVERIDMAASGDHPWPSIRWRPDGRRFTYEKYDRGHQRLRLIEVDAGTGDTRTLLDEKTETFIWSAHTEELRLRLFNYLSNGHEVIYVSERSGWRQLYLLDLESGELKQITDGQWVLRGIGRIDEQARQIWFAASGVFPGQDPYLVHYGRVNFDGSELTWLTAANGHHEIDFRRTERNFSADNKYLVVTHSRVDLPPVTELRRVEDGELILELERAEVTGDWQPLEVFTAKGRDGATDIWGVIRRPVNFDPAKKYPVIEEVYAGPQGAFVPKSFALWSRYDSLARLGFVVVQADGMGTAFRSKAFHDACWRNLADAGFPDRIAWIKAAAEKYPFMDLSRVGITGGSAGGQSAAGALIFHSDFYRAAAANCGCHDNRMDKISWNEQWMGYPVGPHYSNCSNIDNASQLKGRLLLLLGELDNNVPVESTYRFINALVKADKDFEFVLIPGAGHGAGGSRYPRRKLEEFFLRHLQGVEPGSAN